MKNYSYSIVHRCFVYRIYSAQDVDRVSSSLYTFRSQQKNNSSSLWFTSDDYVQISYADGDISKAVLVPSTRAIQIQDACIAPETDKRNFFATIYPDGSGTIGTKVTNDPTVKKTAAFSSVKNARQWLWAHNIEPITGFV